MSGDAIVVTRPTYQSALAVFRGWQAEFIEIELDTDGMRVDALASTLAERARHGRAAPKLVYDVPEFHNPTGVTLERSRREALVALAAHHGMFIVEDDPYRQIRFSGEPVPPIQAFDTEGVVIGLGTFAKRVAPGLRVGWVVGAPEIIARLAALKADGGSCPFTQRILIEYCRAGRLATDLRDRVRTYRAHRDVMAQAVPGVDLHPSIRVKLRGATLITRRGSLPWSQRVVSLTSEQAEATQRRSWRFPAIRETTRTSLFVAWRLAKIRRIGEKEKPLSAAAVNRPLALLRHLLRLAHDEWGVLEQVPKISTVRESQGRLRWLTPAEATTLLTACRKSKNKALPDLVDSACSLACTEARRSR